MKHGVPRGLAVILFAALVLACAVGFLIAVNVPPPAAPYEHALDLRAVARPAPPSAVPVQTAPAVQTPAAPAGGE